MAPKTGRLNGQSEPPKTEEIDFMLDSFENRRRHVKQETINVSKFPYKLLN